MKSALLGLIIFPFLTSAQTLRLGNPFGEFGFLNGGKTIYTKDDSLEEGNFWFPQEPVLANIYLKTGKHYSNIKAFLNLKDNETLFLDSSGQLMTATEAVSIVEFYPDPNTLNNKFIFKTGFPPVDDLTEKSFYQVLAEGKLTLLKSFKISYIDKTPIDRSASVRTYITDEVLYVYDKNKIIQKTKKNKKSIKDFLKDNIAKVENYIRINKINFNSESDLVSVFNFYNNLQSF